MNDSYTSWAVMAGIPDSKHARFFDEAVECAANVIQDLQTDILTRMDAEVVGDSSSAACHFVTQMLASWMAEDMAEEWGWEDEDYVGVAPDAMMEALWLHVHYLKEAKLMAKEGGKEIDDTMNVIDMVDFCNDVQDWTQAGVDMVIVHDGKQYRVDELMYEDGVAKIITGKEVQ